MTRFFTLFLSIFLLSFTSLAQISTPAKWEISMKMTGDDTGEILLSAKIQKGWHVYSDLINPEIGPQPLEIKWETLNGVELTGTLKTDKTPHATYDDIFEAELSWWTESVKLTQAFRATAPKFNIEGTLKYAACDDQNCIPPQKEPFSFSGTAKIAANTEVAPRPTVETAKPESSTTSTDSATDSAATEIAPITSPAESGKENPDFWAPVDFTDADESQQSESSLLYIFIACFLGGFVALLTPCVWPMIPLTVSFFLKKGKSHARSIADALCYGVSIVVIYLLLGLIVTAIFGPSSLNALSTSAICNIIFFLLLVMFAISFFGAFDITLPSKWTTKMDSTAEKTTGLISIFFMAFTLTLVSFSCTGPIIGTLLVEAATSGDKFGPAVGMLGFSLALAIPFCLFALFPSWLQSAPKSGSWMNTVKVVLGFVELALSLKFLSVADLAYGWHMLDREAFLALWIVIFGLLGLYLLGQFSFSHYGRPQNGIGVTRFFLATASLAFTVYLIPGLWGAPLKGVSAFVPPLYTQDFNLYGNGFHEYTDYDEGMAAAAKEHKPVFLDFSGYGCVNCRKMEGAVLDNENVRTMIEDNFIVIKLMVDEKKSLPQPVTVEENGRKIKLETYGDRWSYLQRYKFQANAQPYYVILSDRGQLLSGPYSYDENIAKFSNFLQKGVNKFHSDGEN
ncbi:MAG: thioredoxin family protein [Muribaculum sp.]|nr:thioredoxin family protein [Muribaculum sp.]